MFRYALIVCLFLTNFSTYGEESQRSLKQQLDRLQRDVDDLSKLVYQKNIHNVESENKAESENSMNISAFDMRIYDLEKDIKTLNSNFEEVIFQIDALKKLYEELNIKIDTHLIDKIKESETSEISSNEIKDNSVSENTLGTLIINSEDLSDSTEGNQPDNKILDLSPDEQFQIAFDLLRSQQFDQAKKALEEFIENNSENELAGSSYYWLGEIHLLKKNYREAALIFAEGYQKYPTSIKSPDSLYKLAEALSEIDKIIDACNTLKKFTKEYINHKLINKTNNMITELECE
ncbi:MAG: tetratricopeptide repeat protein [Pelagibacteraceae bacterium]|jgi:tol-pal system protein YbgF|nr:tetratricopeptide repeat protein [Pelagibacteraceae bacterium]MDP6783998.1 tetratricopeptide repeat protein [Alphaproteobacteria bacterium]MBO6465833.1 tetratricopeptide repeat protein [Pelagibacteraceae bacterium]MBO6467285.1 tetratricopeptide repeat protein [Pelagibacteraceae bacterium]MBO6468758.1 tetratricopeptide repeat protein [Pelagibacteraceae bacterium]|tara:strand:- start:668 stop:1540 length:873 start_codon:yes stop_codon:yes gene_type:complete